MSSLRLDHVATDIYLTVANSIGKTHQTLHASHFWRDQQSSAERSLAVN